MKAWVLRDTGKISYEDMAVPEPEDGEVLVRVRAAGICGSDIPRIYRTGAHRMPLVPGHEFAGEVEALGRHTAPDWLHRRVGVYPLIPCRECAVCRQGKYEMCRNYSYLGSRRDGGFAEYVAVPQDNLTMLPEKVTYEQAAMLEPMAVAVHAIRRLGPCVTDTAAVCGLGTIGLLTVMFLRAMGIKRILAVGSKEFQRRKALELGVREEDYCDAGRQDVCRFVRERTDGAGADIFFECVGKNETIVQAVEAAAPGGRICLVGNPYSDVHLEKQTYWKILRSQLTVTGTWNSSFALGQDPESGRGGDWNYVVSCLRSGAVRPEGLITHRYALRDLGQGFLLMRDKREEYIKVMAAVDGQQDGDG